MKSQEEITKSIIISKEHLRGHFDVKKAFEEAKSNINRDVEIILEKQNKEIPVIPEIDYRSILNGDISEDEIRQFVGVDDRIVHSFYSDRVDIENFETTMLSLGNIIQESLNDKLLYNDSKILLNQINKLDIKQACVSASPHELLNKKLQEVQIDKLFEFCFLVVKVNRTVLKQKQMLL